MRLISHSMSPPNGFRGSHNPKVAGSNPAPATQERPAQARLSCYWRSAGLVVGGHQYVATPFESKLLLRMESSGLTLHSCFSRKAGADCFRPKESSQAEGNLIVGGFQASVWKAQATTERSGSRAWALVAVVSRISSGRSGLCRPRSGPRALSTAWVASGRSRQGSRRWWLDGCPRRSARARKSPAPPCGRQTRYLQA